MITEITITRERVFVFQANASRRYNRDRVGMRPYHIRAYRPACYSLRYINTYMHVHLYARTRTYARTTHTHYFTQDLTHVISSPFNHHPPAHTNLANCIALFALFFNIRKPTKPNWLYQPPTSLADFLVRSSACDFLVVSLTVTVRLSCRLSHCHGPTFLSPVRRHTCYATCSCLWATPATSMQTLPLQVPPWKNCYNSNINHMKLIILPHSYVASWIAFQLLTYSSTLSVHFSFGFQSHMYYSISKGLIMVLLLKLQSN